MSYHTRRELGFIDLKPFTDFTSSLQKGVTDVQRTVTQITGGGGGSAAADAAQKKALEDVARANEAAARARAIQSPVYSASRPAWVMPAVAVGGVAALGALGFLIMKKRR